eukprot:PhM_4_TR16194/c0_g1_i1/m.68864
MSSSTLRFVKPRRAPAPSSGDELSLDAVVVRLPSDSTSPGVYEAMLRYESKEWLERTNMTATPKSTVVKKPDLNMSSLMSLPTSASDMSVPASPADDSLASVTPVPNHTTIRRQIELYKTTLCTAFMRGQTCAMGPRCAFAHGRSEVRTREINIQVVRKICKRGVHHASIVDPINYKVRMCSYGAACPFRNGECMFAHDAEEIRSVAVNRRALERIAVVSRIGSFQKKGTH